MRVSVGVYRRRLARWHYPITRRGVVIGHLVSIPFLRIAWVRKPTKGVVNA